MVFFTVAC